jgi:hypothetical protein
MEPVIEQPICRERLTCQVGVHTFELSRSSAGRDDQGQNGSPKPTVRGADLSHASNGHTSLVDRGTEPSKDGLGSALIMRLMLDLPKDCGYSCGSADQQTLAELISSSVSELHTSAVEQ